MSSAAKASAEDPAKPLLAGTVFRPLRPGGTCRDHGLFDFLPAALGHDSRYELADHRLRAGARRRETLCRPDRDQSAILGLALYAAGGAGRRARRRTGDTGACVDLSGGDRRAWASPASSCAVRGFPKGRALFRLAPAFYALLVIMPGNAFSQREHIAMAFFLPLLALTAWRARGEGIRSASCGDRRARRALRQRACAYKTLLCADGADAGAAGGHPAAKPAAALRAGILDDRRRMRRLSGAGRRLPPRVHRRRLSDGCRNLCAGPLPADGARQICSSLCCRDGAGLVPVEAPRRPGTGHGRHRSPRQPASSASSTRARGSPITPIRPSSAP